MEEVHSQHMPRTAKRKLSKPALSVSRHNAEGEKGSADPASSFFFFSSHSSVSFISTFQTLCPTLSAAALKNLLCFQLEFEPDDTEP